MAQVVDRNENSQTEYGKDNPTSCTSTDNVEEPLQQESLEQSPSWLTGWRLHLTTVGVLLCLYLVNIEVTIVSTSLVTIVDDLLGFDRSSWVITSYLVTYTGFIIIWSKFSDVAGRKVAICSTMVTFIAFSAGCGASKTMTELITFRALQGIGAAGTYSMSILAVYDMVPMAKLGLYGALISVTIALATLTGPIFGGLFARSLNWRWVFYLNLPSGALAVILLIIAMPRHFGSHSHSSSSILKIFSRKSIRRLDFVGAFFLLAASLLLVTALSEASTRYSWASGVIIALLVLSALSWPAFLLWEWHVTKAERPEPIFPWRFFKSRSWLAMLIITFLVGVPFNVIAISLPQRFQVVSQTSALGAGIRLIPYSTVAAVCSAIANIACSKGKIPPIYLLMLGAVLQTVGLALFTTLPKSGTFITAGYGYEVLAGAGIGTTFGILILTTPFVVEKRDLAVATGAIIQLRFLGGAIGLAIASTVLNSLLKKHLHGIISDSDISSLMQSTEIIATFSPEMQEQIREIFADSYDSQFKIMIGFAAAQIPVSALLWQKGKQLKTG
ncbi:hypothetical protein N7462_001833 [Penicillium macrosclerotiorum]|uniref:uncharacterized protein n=1 Tax=Penicillium macrosclerotiorum TaxID=303699 RepID=UPI00254674C3|nr:uncharacterized protein N7462_001833 [Penicillium macrosclerotiorum]KAJ5692410.1 hypothetical protein N7462_001833 [Penicillium macrosclerotiorum]